MKLERLEKVHFFDDCKLKNRPFFRSNRLSQQDAGSALSQDVANIDSRQIVFQSDKVHVVAHVPVYVY